KAFDSVGYQNIYDDTFAIIGYYPVYEKATYSKPVIMDIDGDDTLEILVVNSLGTIRMYEINADQVSGEFKQIDSFYHFPAFQLRKVYTPDVGNQTAIALAGLNRDSVPESVMGNNRGGIKYLKPLF